MKYMGSKARLSKDILPIILDGRKENQWYVEPFAGGMNIIDKVSGKRMANDINEYLIAMWLGFIEHNWRPPKEISKDEYINIRAKQNENDPRLIGWVGFNCSYSGKFFDGYAGKTKTKINTVRDYQKEALKNVMKQIDNLQGVVFSNQEYYEMHIPDESIIYCDPPYANTTKYNSDFDHDLFFQWIRDMAYEGHTVYVSEYSAPEDFECVFSKELSSSLSANGKVGGNKKSIEKLFTFRQ